MIPVVEPTPASIIARHPSAKTFALVRLNEAPTTCVSSGVIAPQTCFVGFRPQFEEALSKALGGVLSAQPTADPDYRGAVNLLHLRMTNERGYSIYAIDWGFTLVDRSGRIVVRVSDVLLDHQRVSWSTNEQLQALVESMQATILDRIVAAVGQSEAAAS